VDVNLTSGDPSVTVTPSVTVPKGSTSATFKITTKGVDAPTKVAITAQSGKDKKSAVLTVVPPSIQSLSTFNNIVAGGSSISVYVNLNGIAGPSGMVVGLKASSTVVTVPSTVNVYSGESYGNFAVQTTNVTTPQRVTITATLGKTSKTLTITVRPPTLTSFFGVPGDMVGGVTALATVGLDGPAPSPGATVSLTSNSIAATLPSSITVLSGQSSAAIIVSTQPVDKKQSVTLTATYGSVSKTITFTVERPNLGSISLSPTAVQGGQTSAGTITISSAAGPHGLTIKLSSNNPAATVPATVTVPAGQVSVTFTVQTSAVPSTTGATIRATLGNQTTSAVLSIS
jgi:hypothetical protein